MSSVHITETFVSCNNFSVGRPQDTIDLWTNLVLQITGSWRGKNATYFNREQKTSQKQTLKLSF